MRILRSRTVVEGSTWFFPTQTAADVWSNTRGFLSLHVFAMFSCKWFDCIQSHTSSRQADRVDWSWLADRERQQPCICMSSAYRWVCTDKVLPIVKLSAFSGRAFSALCCEFGTVCPPTLSLQYLLLATQSMSLPTVLSRHSVPTGFVLPLPYVTVMDLKIAFTI